MDKKAIIEMEQIQKGLEAFLEQELAGGEQGKPEENPAKQVEQEPLERMDIDEDDSYWQDWDAKGAGDIKQKVKRDSGRKSSGKTGQKETGGTRHNGKRRAASQDTGGQKVRKKRSGLKKFLIAVLILAVLLGYGWNSLVGLVYDKMTFEENTSLAAEPMKEDGVVNILLIGNDSRENGVDGRSDAMILLSISSRTGTIYMTSLLRDMYVDIPGHDGNRLNAAYSYGGPELLLETVEQNFGIHVNRYMLVNFQAFANLVDAVGGVDLELTTEEVEYINGYLVEYNMLTGRPEGTDYLDTSKSGLLHINGPQALAYSRNRYLGTDFGRTERQRKVLSAVMAKAPGALLKNPKGLLDVLSNLTTNLTQRECLQLSLMAGKLLTYPVVQDSIPVKGSYENAKIRGMAVLKVDFAKNRQYLQDTIYGKESGKAADKE